MNQLFSWSLLNGPFLVCPPMDGITDVAFRDLISEQGGSALLYTEFVNVKGLIYKNPKTILELSYTEKQNPIIAQLFGAEPDDFFLASKIVAEMGFHAIDINMGCPAHKVASKGSGCSLMGDTKRASNIVEQTIVGIKNSNSPHLEVSCKMRLGLDKPDLFIKHGNSMIESGAKAIAIHGRTLKQMYSGSADWIKIREFVMQLKDRFKYSKEFRPKVLGSGDVTSIWDAFLRILTTGVDGVMIGRGCFGMPWIFEKSKYLMMCDYINKLRNEFNLDSGLFTEDLIRKSKFYEEAKIDLSNTTKAFEEIKSVAIHHSELMYKYKGNNGIIQMRKHFGWYFRGFNGAKELRDRLVRVNNINEIYDILEKGIGDS